MNKLDREIKEGTQTSLEDFEYNHNHIPLNKLLSRKKRFMIFTTAMGLVAEEMPE